MTGPILEKKLKGAKAVTKASVADNITFFYIANSVGNISGKKYIGAKAGGEVTISVKTFHFSGKYSTGPILQKKH